MVSLSSPSDSEGSDYVAELEQYRHRLTSRFQEPGTLHFSSLLQKIRKKSLLHRNDTG